MQLMTVFSMRMMLSKSLTMGLRLILQKSAIAGDTALFVMKVEKRWRVSITRLSSFD